jgi:2-(1,2-epoxy-1,2-dihydrophenyl)acetyl-CoA isomerase
LLRCPGASEGRRRHDAPSASAGGRRRARFFRCRLFFAMLPATARATLKRGRPVSDVLLSETCGPLLVVTLSRPAQRNALDPVLCQALVERLAEAAADPAVRAVVLTGAGGTFSVGGDVKAMNQGAGREAAAGDRIAALRACMEASRLLHEMPKPTVAAIEGAAAGAGLCLALACDFRIASRSAKLTTAFAKVGLSGDYGGSYFLARIVSPAKARELYLLSPVLSGEEAEAIGLVTAVAEPGRALVVARDFATPLAEGPTLTLGRIKQNLALAAGGATLAECFDAEARNHVACTATADHREAAAAFVAKRKPAFTGQ